MRNTLLLQSKQIKVFISTLILLCCGVLFQNTAWSESNILQLLPMRLMQ